MSLTMRWVGADELDRVAETRAYCYFPSLKDHQRARDLLRGDPRAGPGDYLLAEHDGVALGTATSLSLMMHVRGGTVPAQGVAWVGTIKTHRRCGGQEVGVASQVMHECLRKARERGQVVSALMPFRASFYEHFGYGVVERRNEWTVPLTILPSGNCTGFRFMGRDDLTAMNDCRGRMLRESQCDFDRSPQGWTNALNNWSEGYAVVDQHLPSGPIGAWLFIQEVRENNRTMIRMSDYAWESPAAFVRVLKFLASLKDQYSAAIIPLPVDVQLWRVLKESQVPHRSSEHATARVTTCTRMQVRIVDHQRFLQALHLPEDTTGGANVAVAECEGIVSMFHVEHCRGRLEVKSTSASPDIHCDDVTWAAIACGDMRATDAARLGLIEVRNESALKALDALAVGPSPFSTEYF